MRFNRSDKAFPPLQGRDRVGSVTKPDTLAASQTTMTDADPLRRPVGRDLPLKGEDSPCLRVAAMSLAILFACGSFSTPVLADKSQPLAERRAIYAPWNPADMAARRKEYGLIGPGAQKPVPPPAFPSSLKKPDNIEALMPAARAASRQSQGRAPLGLVNAGKHLLIVAGEIRDTHPNMMVQEAIKRAMEERGVKTTVLTVWELLGITEDEYKDFRKGIRTYTISDGQRELEYFFNFTGIMPDVDKGRAWVREQDPDLYAATWPAPKYDNETYARMAKDYVTAVPKALIAWLDKHPEIDWIVWRSGGRTNTRKLVAHHGEKVLGNYTYLDLYDLMSQVPDFPPDVWRMVETKTIEPIAFADRAEVTDPEGTAFGYDVSEAEAKAWGAGIYNQGHLFMFPAQATGRYPYSLVEFPAALDNYQPLLLPEVNGVIAATSSHAATFPRQEIKVVKGKIADIKGGGLYGEGFRLFLNYPGTQNLQWPHAPKPGYWWLFEAGMGTNPKYFKHPGEVYEGNNLSERNVAGVIHWAFGAEASQGPGGDKIAWAKETDAFATQHNVPRGHSMHQHNLLPTYQIRLRDLDQWATLEEHGGLTALSDVGVRALASRYGNPDTILRRDYIPALPGINAPGSYDDYARAPGAYWTRWAERINAGTYEYFKP